MILEPGVFYYNKKIYTSRFHLKKITLPSLDQFNDEAQLYNESLCM